MLVGSAEDELELEDQGRTSRRAKARALRTRGKKDESGMMDVVQGDLKRPRAPRQDSRGGNFRRSTQQRPLRPRSVSKSFLNDLPETDPKLSFIINERHERPGSQSV